MKNNRIGRRTGRVFTNEIPAALSAWQNNSDRNSEWLGLKCAFIMKLNHMYKNAITQYVLSVLYVVVQLRACGERRAKLAYTARWYKQVYCYRGVAKNILAL
jgi:hypothetical protein